MPTCTYKGCTAPADFQAVEFGPDFEPKLTGSRYCDEHADQLLAFIEAEQSIDAGEWSGSFEYPSLMPIPDPFELYLLSFSGEEEEWIWE